MADRYKDNPLVSCACFMSNFEPSMSTFVVCRQVMGFDLRNEIRASGGRA